MYSDRVTCTKEDDSVRPRNNNTHQSQLSDPRGLILSRLKAVISCQHLPRSGFAGLSSNGAVYRQNDGIVMSSQHLRHTFVISGLYMLTAIVLLTNESVSLYSSWFSAFLGRFVRPMAPFTTMSSSLLQLAVIVFHHPVQ